MVDIKDIEAYLEYDENNNPIGLKRGTPQNIRIAYRNWCIEQEDKERLARLYKNEE